MARWKYRKKRYCTAESALWRKAGPSVYQLHRIMLKIEKILFSYVVFLCQATNFVNTRHVDTVLLGCGGLTLWCVARSVVLNPALVTPTGAVWSFLGRPGSIRNYLFYLKPTSRSLFLSTHHLQLPAPSPFCGCCAVK